MRLLGNFLFPRVGTRVYPRAHAQDSTIKYSPIVPHSDTLEIILRFAQNDSTVSPIVRISKNKSWFTTIGRSVATGMRSKPLWAYEDWNERSECNRILSLGVIIRHSTRRYAPRSNPQWIVKAFVRTLRVYLHDVWSACWSVAVEARNCISVAIAPENSKVLLPHPSSPLLPGDHGTSWSRPWPHDGRRLSFLVAVHHVLSHFGPTHFNWPSPIFKIEAHQTAKHHHTTSILK